MKTSGQIKTVAVDYKKLTVELFKRDVTLSDASIALGHADSYINTLKSCGLPMKSAYLRILESLYGINQEDILLQEEAPVEDVCAEDETTKDDSWLTEETLYNVIYEATYNAMKKALTE